MDVDKFYSHLKALERRIKKLEDEHENEKLTGSVRIELVGDKSTRSKSFGKLIGTCGFSSFRKDLFIIEERFIKKLVEKGAKFKVLK